MSFSVACTSRFRTRPTARPTHARPTASSRKSLANHHGSNGTWCASAFCSPLSAAPETCGNAISSAMLQMRSPIASAALKR